jgi:hypothetical protein
MIGSREGISLGSSELLSWKYQKILRNMRRISSQDKGKISRTLKLLMFYQKILQMTVVYIKQCGFNFQLQ